MLQAFLLGDEHALTSIYNQYVDQMFAYGISLGFEKETLKDAIHDVFCKLYFNRKLLKNVNNLKFYLFRMLKNRLLDIMKSEMEVSDISLYDMSFSVKVNILDEMIGEEDRKAVEHKIEHLLNLLTNRQREAIYLRYIQGMEYEEVGYLLSMTPKAVRNLIARAIERMRK